LKELSDVSVKLLQIIRSIPKRIFNNNAEKIFDFYDLGRYNIHRDIAGLILERGLQNVSSFISRGDFIFTKDGLKCVEYNISSNVGGWQAEVARTWYVQNHIVNDFLNESGKEVSAIDPLYEGYLHFIQTTLESTKETDTQLNLAVLVPDLDSLTSNYHKSVFKKCLNAVNKSLIGELMFCAWNDLKVRNNRVYLNDVRIHAVSDQGQFCPIQVYLSQNQGFVTLLNGPVGHLVSNKINLAILTDEKYAHCFTPEELALIKAHIPTTYIVPVNLDKKKGDFFRDNKDNYILKSGDGASGNDVLIGKDTTVDVWEQWTIRAMKEKNWIIQEFVESIPFVYQSGDSGTSDHNVIWGLFVFGNSYAGGFLRLGKKNTNHIINTAQGATESYMLQVVE
jgi:hypothetical protein